MDEDNSPNYGGGTPLQDEPEYDYSIQDGGNDFGSSDVNFIHTEEVMDEDNASHSDNEYHVTSSSMPASPAGSIPASPIHSDNGPASPDSTTGPPSPRYTPQNDNASQSPQSPFSFDSASGSPSLASPSPGSPPVSHSPASPYPRSPSPGLPSPRSPSPGLPFPASPLNSMQQQPGSPIGNISGSESPMIEEAQHDFQHYSGIDPSSSTEEMHPDSMANSGSAVESPVEYTEPASPGSGANPVSPGGLYDAPESPAGSPQYSQSASAIASPADSIPASPDTKSRSPSPAESRKSRSPSPTGSVASRENQSRSVSPVGSQNSRSQSPATSIRSVSRSQSRSPVRSRSNSPTSGQSRSGSASPVRSRSGSPASNKSGSPARERSRSKSASPVRSRSGSPASVRSRSISGSPPVKKRRLKSSSPVSGGSRSSDRSRSGSPASRQSSRSRSGSRSVSPAGSGTPPYSPLGSQGSADGPGSPAGSDKGGSDMENTKGSDDESDKEDLVADIFGSSDEEEEFEGFGEADVEATARKKERKTAVLSDDEGEGLATEDVGAEPVLPEISDDENDDAARRSGKVDGMETVSDFDLMMAKKKEENQKRRRKRKDFDLINDSDDLIADMINKMKVAAEEDRGLNMEKKPAIRKLKYLPTVVSQLKKADLHGAFLDCGVLGAMTEWLAPLPDKCLPNLQIREAFLKILQEFPNINPGALKTSGIGKAVMYLYKHPKEIKDNKDRAGKLINDWSRPLFNLTSNYKSLSKEEREQRDYDQIPKRRRTSLEDGGQTPRKGLDQSLAGEQKALRPGDPGWIYRARVPMPSNKDYVIRPKWKTEEEGEQQQRKAPSKKEPTRYDKHVRKFAEKKKNKKVIRAVTISIEGRNMTL